MYTFFASPTNGSTYKLMVVLLLALTLIDTILTNIGLNVGAVELNNFVLATSLGSWTLFRISLMVYLAAVFLLGYRFAKKHSFIKALSILKAGLFLLNAYIGTVVCLGFLAIASVLII